MSSSLRVINPVHLPAELPCERHPLRSGARLGYKPNAVELSTGELLLANFHTHYETYDDGSMCEHIVLHRSADGGRTWRSRHVDHLWGREPYLTRLCDDVLIITTHFLEPDVRNRSGHTTVYLHRSDDGGQTWTSAHLDVGMIPEEVPYTYTSRNIVELADGTCILGVGCGHGTDYLFRRTPDHFDSGGGFGNTLRLRDGALLTPYSYLEADPEIEELLRTGAFMEKAIFERYRDRALPYYRRWVEGITWERLRDADRVTQQHCFMGCTQVMNLSGPVTEVCRWALPNSAMGS